MAHHSGVDADIRLHAAAGNALKYVPGFLYIVVFFVLGQFFISDPRATMISWGESGLSWAQVLLVGAALVGLADQMTVSHPGVDNTLDALTMVGLAGIQIVLFFLGAAGVLPLKMFANTEFVLLTLISATQAVVAVLINARTLRRTIGVGDNE